MHREMGLKIVLVVTGVLFLATAYFLFAFVRREPSLAMMLTLYVTLGVFLLLAIRDPWTNRSLIAFTAWSSLAHAALMGAQALLHIVDRGELVGVVLLIVIAVLLLVLAPRRPQHDTVFVANASAAN